jgi:hypothetical protein
MSSSAVGGAWHQAYNEMTGGDGYAGGEGYAEGAGGISGCSECNSGRMCDCARSCAAVCKKKAKEKIQCAYAIGFAVCLVFVLFIWMMWPMIGSAVSAFSSKPADPAHSAYMQKGPFSQPPQPSPYSAHHQQSPFATPVSTATSGAYAAPHPPQYMPCRSWIDQGLPLTQTSGYLNGVDNEPGATNGRQMGGKYRGVTIDHPGAEGGTFDQAPPSAPLHPDPSAPAAPVASKFGPMDRSLFSGSRFSSNRFIGGTSAQYPSEWATPGRDEDITEMTLRCAAQHQYGDVPTALPAAPAAAAAAAPVVSHFGGLDKRF